DQPKSPLKPPRTASWRPQIHQPDHSSKRDCSTSTHNDKRHWRHLHQDCRKQEQQDHSHSKHRDHSFCTVLEVDCHGSYSSLNIILKILMCIDHIIDQGPQYIGSEETDIGREC